MIQIRKSGENDPAAIFKQPIPLASGGMNTSVLIRDLGSKLSASTSAEIQNAPGKAGFRRWNLVLDVFTKKGLFDIQMEI